MMYDICYCAFLQIWADHRKHEEPWYEDSIASKECFGASSSHTNGSVEIETSFELWFWSLYFSSSGYKRLKFSFANRPKLHLCLIFSIYFVSVQNICYWGFFFLKKARYLVELVIAYPVIHKNHMKLGFRFLGMAFWVCMGKIACVYL